jgi:GT2 family glycosyltransferase
MKNQVLIMTINYNQNAYTLDCVRSILQSSHQNIILHLIDNGSTEQNYIDLQDLLPDDERLALHRIVDNKGYVGGINYGFESGASLDPDYYLIMNNDTLLDKDAVSELFSAAKRYNNNAIVSGKVYHYDNKNYLQTIGNAKSKKGLLDYPEVVKNRREEDIGQYDEEMEMGMLDDIYWMIPKEVFNKVGLYSDYFFLYGEQADYALRAVKMGVRLIYTPKAKLWHKGSITTSNGNTKSAKLEYWRTFATLKLAFLHLPQQEFKAFQISWILKNLLKRFWGLLSLKLGGVVVKAFIHAIHHFRFWKVIRYKDNGYNPYA